ncbi:MAG: glycosyltransferase family 1 protein [Thermomicrobiaceae bacterium]
MRIALDYTPAINQIAGVGRYTRSLFAALLNCAPEDTEWLLWHTSRVEEEARLPTGEYVSHSRLPVSARWSNLLWHRVGVPISIERLIGNVSLVHGTDFVVPPSRSPSIVTVHDLSYALMPHLAFPRLRSYLERAVPRSIDRADRVVAVSETTKRDLCEYYEISPNRVDVVHHAADPLFSPPDYSDIMAMLAQLGLRRPYFIIVGTVEPRKNHLTLLRAFERVHAEHPEASLVVVGREGWLAGDIMRALAQAAEKMPVVYLQGIRDSLLPALYAASTALVYPSRYEGFGLPVLEAMASGTAVIASNTPAIVEVAGDAALLAAPEDDETLARAMTRLIEHPEERDELLERGTARAAQFSWDRAANRHLEIYQEIADG